MTFSFGFWHNQSKTLENIQNYFESSSLNLSIFCQKIFVLRSITEKKNNVDVLAPRDVCNQNCVMFLTSSMVNKCLTTFTFKSLHSFNIVIILKSQVYFKFIYGILNGFDDLNTCCLATVQLACYLHAFGKLSQTRPGWHLICLMSHSSAYLCQIGV